MPDKHPEIEKLHKALTEILKKDEAAPNIELVVMTAEEFLAYAQGQVAKARDEEPALAAGRLKHLQAIAKAVVEKNAFDADGTLLPVYTGDLSRQATTAYSEQAADHTEKPGSAISFDSANTSANPSSNFGKSEFSFAGKVGKSAVQAFAEAHAGDEPSAFKAALLAVLDGKDPEDVAKASKPKPKADECGWPRDLNADEIDTEYTF